MQVRTLPSMALQLSRRVWCLHAHTVRERGLCPHSTLPSGIRPTVHACLQHQRDADFNPWHDRPAGRRRSCDRGLIRCLATSGSPGEQSKPSVLTLPTLLTIGRVVAIPFLIAAWYTPAPWSTTVVTSIFIAASLTDWLDGYLARTMKLSTAFGAFLDPVADKLMVAAVLILLSTQPMTAGPFAGNTWVVPCCTLAIIGREITMSALREWAAALGGEARKAVAVSNLGKWKTATQMTSLTVLLALRDGPLPGTLGDVAALAGPGLLIVATYLTLLSLWEYTRALWRFMV